VSIEGPGGPAGPPGGYPPGPPGGYPPGPPGGFPPPGPPGEYPPPPPGGYPPATYGPGGPPPERKGRPWWFWLLAGCGCFIIVCAVIAGLVAYQGYRYWKAVEADVGEVSQASVEKSLEGIPLYPNGTLELDTTKAMLTGFRVGERAFQQKPGSVLAGIAVMKTSDEPRKILAFYDEKLRAMGWKQVEVAQPEKSSGEQHIYQKGDDLASVVVDSSGTATRKVSVFLGGKDLTALMKEYASKSQ